MSSTVINPKASVTISVEGLSISCFNKSYNKNQGRWEVAFPRFDDHNLKIRIGGLGDIFVDENVKIIEVKDRAGTPVNPKHEVGATFNRKNKNHDRHDFRWLVDFTNGTELPHGQVSLITKKENPDRVNVTMMYVYDATFYTKNLVAESLILSEQSETAPVVDGVFSILPGIASAKLDHIDDFGLEAKTMGIDIESSKDSSIDIVFDGAIKTTILGKDTIQEIRIENLEPITPSTSGRFVESDNIQYGLGDFYRYYELFYVRGSRFHLWTKSSLASESSGSTSAGSDRTTDCGGVRVDLANLDGLL